MERSEYGGPTVKHSVRGSVMVWSCMAANGMGNLVSIDGILDKYEYLHVLKNNLNNCGHNLRLLENFYFQKNNDPKHRAKWIVKKSYNDISHMLNTRTQSPDRYKSYRKFMGKSNKFNQINIFLKKKL